MERKNVQAHSSMELDLHNCSIVCSIESKQISQKVQFLFLCAAFHTIGNHLICFFWEGEIIIYAMLNLHKFIHSLNRTIIQFVTLQMAIAIVIVIVRLRVL